MTSCGEAWPSLLLLLLGSGTLDVGAAGLVESLEALESELLCSGADTVEAIDGFTDSAETSSELNLGGVDVALGVLLSLGDLVVALVDLLQGDHSLGALLALLFVSGQADATGGGGVVEAGQVEGVARELLTVELDNVGVPPLGELPDDFAWDLHCLHNELKAIFDRCDYLPMRNY